MSKLLFSLRGVPEDEAQEVRELLEQEAIDFYETSAGNWGISMPALWLKNAEGLEKAQALLKAYQQQRYEQQHGIYLQLKQNGEHKTLWTSFKERPVLFLIYVSMMAFIGFVSVKWLFELGLSF